MQPASAVTASCVVQRPGLVEYGEAWEEQRRLVGACRHDAQARLLLLEHPPTYTFGVRGRQEHLLLSEPALAELGATVHRVDRGGDVTFHGPGQLVGYPILDLRRCDQGPLWYVRSLEQTLIEALAAFGVSARQVRKRVGVWVGEAKIAAIGVRVSRGVTSHGFALNVDPDLRYFSYIVPCGLPNVSVTSIAEVLHDRTMNGAASIRQDMRPPSGGGGEAPPGSDGAPSPRPPATPLPREGEGTGVRVSSAPPTHDEGVPTMPAVMDAVVDAFGRVFGLEMLDADRGGGQPPAQGGRIAVPRSR